MNEAGARNNKTDQQRINEAHDTLVSLGANCPGMKEAAKPTKRQKLAAHFKRQAEAVSYDAIKRKIRDKLELIYPTSPNSDYPYISELFDEYVIIEIPGPRYEYWQAGYTLNGETIELAPQVEWTKVERQQSWVAKTEARQRKREALKRWATENTPKQK
jgi:hypothetical protein